MARKLSSLGKGKASRLVWDISELTKVNKFLDQLKVRGIKAMQSELKKISKDIVIKARENAPELSGRLRKSGRVIAPRVGAKATKFAYQVVFGGIAVSNQTGRGPKGSIFVDYASLIELSHPTKSRYLEKAFNAMIPQMEGRIIGAVRKHFKKGFRV